MLTRDQKEELTSRLRNKLQIASFAIRLMIKRLNRMQETIHHLANGLSEDIKHYSRDEEKIHEEVI